MFVSLIDILHDLHVQLRELVTCRCRNCSQAQKDGKSESELDEMWWKQAGELVAGYYKQREEVEKDVEGLLVVWVFIFFQPSLSS